VKLLSCEIVEVFICVVVDVDLLSCICADVWIC